MGGTLEEGKKARRKHLRGTVGRKFDSRDWFTPESRTWYKIGRQGERKGKEQKRRKSCRCESESEEKVPKRFREVKKRLEFMGRRASRGEGKEEQPERGEKMKGMAKVS